MRGAWTSLNVDSAPVDSLKTRYVLRAMVLLKMDAVNVGPTDIAQSMEYFNQIKAKWPEAMESLVSANVFLKDKPGQLAFPPYRIVQKTPVRRFDGKGGHHRSGPRCARTSLIRLAARRKRTSRNLCRVISSLAKPRDCLPKVLEELRPKVDLLIVLYSGDMASGVELAKKFQQVDELVCAGTPTDPKTVFYREGHDNVFVNQNVMGRELGLAPLVRNAQGQWEIGSTPLSLAVGRDLKPDGQLEALIAEFKKETESLDTVVPEASVERIFGGANRCAGCHQDFNQDWSKTQHARALQSLIDRGQQFNPECLPCHVVGFRQANGFYSVNHPLSRNMYNVQCENCHGPSGKHAELQRKLMTGERWMKPEDLAKLKEDAAKVLPSVDVPSSTCLKCHTPENDNHFVYSEKIGKVNHSEVLSRHATPGAATPVEQPAE